MLAENQGKVVTLYRKAATLSTPPSVQATHRFCAGTAVRASPSRAEKRVPATSRFGRDLTQLEPFCLLLRKLPIFRVRFRAQFAINYIGGHFSVFALFGAACRLSAG